MLSSSNVDDEYRLPLPKEVPMTFRVLPEYIVEDIVDYLHFAVQYVVCFLWCARHLIIEHIVYLRTTPHKFELAGKLELMTFVLTFLTSTWYIKNPFLKSKINDVRTPNSFVSISSDKLILSGVIHEHLGIRP